MSGDLVNEAVSGRGKEWSLMSLRRKTLLWTVEFSNLIHEVKK